jgi:uncharacterized protein (DUF433 family)/DNA-binding transcriptional regulator YiaG
MLRESGYYSFRFLPTFSEAITNMPRTIRKADSLQELREAPSYGLAEAARYLRIPISTLKSWVVGRSYPTQGGTKQFKPLIKAPSMATGPQLLSFMNLVEIHVLDAIRREHKISLPKVRTALDFLRAKFPSNHPLVDQSFETDGANLFVEKYGNLINITKSGQLAIRELIAAHLRRIERDSHGVPVKLYPFTRTRQDDEPRVVVIDPEVAFGRPVLASTGIPTAIIADRLKAGESVNELASDYGRSQEEIIDAIRCELPSAA